MVVSDGSRPTGWDDQIRYGRSVGAHRGPASRPTPSTRFLQPRLPSDYLARPRLLDVLDRGLSRRLTLVSAPAGFGKTTLLNAWNPPGHAVAWLSLDEREAELRAFVQSLIGAIAVLAPGSARATLDLLDRVDLPPATTLAAHLADDLAGLPAHLDGQPDRLVIVLDEYQTIQHCDIQTFVTHLVEQLPDGVHLVVVTRLDPPLPLARLRAHGALSEIRLEQLAFTPDEAQVFLRQTMPPDLDDDVVSRIIGRANGWPAGLRLATMALSVATGATTAPLDLDARGARYVRDFFIHDVLAAQPPETRTLLLRCSILDRLSAPLLDALSAESERVTPGLRWLQILQRSNLFITALDASGTWFELHHLFREALRRRLLTEYTADEVRACHQRVSAWFAQQGMVDEAIQHALAADETDVAITIVAESLPAFLDREDEPGRLEAWLKPFPPAIVDRSPALLLARALSLLLRERLAEAPQALRAAEAALDAEAGRDPSAADAVRGALDACWAYVWHAREDGERTVERSELAVRRLRHQWPTLCGYAEYLHAGGLAMLGRVDEAEAWIEACRASATPSDRPRLSLLLRSRGRLSFDQCRIRELGQTGRQLLVLTEAHDLPRTAAWGHHLTGLARYAWGELDEAQDQFLSAAEYRPRVGTFLALDSTLGLAMTLQALGDGAGAQAALRDLAVDVQSSGGVPAHRLYQSGLARLALARGDLEEAGRLLWSVRSDEAVSFRSFVEAPEVTLTRWLLLQDGRTALEEAVVTVERLRQAALGQRHPRAAVLAAASQALLRQAQGDADGALSALRQAVESARAGGLIQVFVDFGAPMQPLLLEMLRLMLHPDRYLARVLAAFPPVTGPAATTAPTRSMSRSSSEESLTWREQEILSLLDDRLSDQEIAAALYISAWTVKKHAANIYQKLQVGSRREAVARAHAIGLLPLVRPASTP